MMPCFSSLLVCFAVREEAKFFRPPPQLASSVRVAVTGMGRGNAVRTVTPLLPSVRPDLVLTCGFAGGLDPSLHTGSLLFSADPREPVGPLLAELGARLVQFHCAARVATTVQEKQQLRALTQADAVEMESGAIQDLCARSGVRCATLRVISDGADEDLPVDFNTLMTERMEISYGKLAWALVQAPGRVAGLLQLQRKTAHAGRVLGDALSELLRRGHAGSRGL